MTTISSVILVDKRIQDHETIVAAIKADGVRAIVFDVADIDAQWGESFQYILDKIAELGATSFSNIGIVQHNTGAPFHRFFAETQGEVSTIAGVETTDPTLQTWAGFAAFITTLKTTYGVQNVDLMACALYSDPNWKYIIDTLAVQTGVTIRASTDDTGAAALGGDWFLESHTGVNLKDVYFTEAIEDFRGVLFYSNRYDSRTQQTAKSFAPGRAFGWGYSYYGGDTSNNITGGSLSSDIIAVYGNFYAMAALRTGGSVVTWGDMSSGAAQQKWASGAVGSVAGSLSSGVTKLYMNTNAMSALKTDGTVITWGNNSYGGDSSTVTLTSVVDIYSNQNAVAALKSNGSVVTWGSPSYGSDSSAIASSISSNVVSVNMAYRAGAALKKNGSVITWGSATYGGNSSSVTSELSSGVVVVYTDNEYSYAALKNNGTVITWGYSTTGYILSSSVNLTNTVSVFSNTSGGYAALKLDGSVVTWGQNAYGGDSTGKGLSTAKVVSIYGGSSAAFAALTSTGTVITWGYGPTGGDSSAVSASLTNVVAIYSNNYAFAALKNNGQVITWGNSSYGGTSTSVSNDISRNVVAVYSSSNAFAALRKDGKTIVWGDITYGGAFNVAIAGGGTRAVVGGDLNSGIVSINNTSFGFAAIQNTTATTFDLSASYYTDNDRYDILRNKENRRRVNLTTLNNNVFTLSSARDIERFNYMIPSGVGLFRIIVPDFVDSSYSITSTASIPGGASINYIIACEEGEPVTISGTTYINYGAFVYRRNADNTFTKMTTDTIGGLTYNLYGGDGINSSGIALRYRLGAFAVPTKTAGDASFNLTAPVSDSSGAITFTSSNTNVATVTSGGGTVTIVAAGTTTITATQAGGSNYASEMTGYTSSSVVTASAATVNLTWWSISLSTTGQYQTAVATGNIYTSSDYGVTWTARESSRSWKSVSISSTGQYQTAVVNSGYLYTSNDYGVTWTERNVLSWGAVPWYSVSVSSTGQYQTAVVYTNTYSNTNGYNTILTSSNYGVTWTNRGNNNAWISVSISSTGQYQSAVAVNTSTIWVSINYGVNWTERALGISSQSWQSISVSSTGQYQTAVAMNSGSIMVSSDYGGTWVARDFTRYWKSVSMSSTGQYQTAGTGPGNIYTSSDYGVTWTARDSSRYWTSVSVSSTGQYQSSASESGLIYFSTNYGLNWSTIASYEFVSVSGSLVVSKLSSTLGALTVPAKIPTDAPFTLTAPTSTISSIISPVNTITSTASAIIPPPDIWDISYGTTWGQLGAEILGTQASELSGISVSLSADGTVVAIGSNGYDKAGGTSNANTDEGRVRIYKYNGTSWGQLGAEILGTQASELSGISVSLSADGTIVAIGAYSYNVTGTDEGRVRIYKYNGTSWTPMGSEILGTQTGEYSGNSVNLSADGTTVAIGSYYYDVTGTNNEGRTRFYKYNGTSWNPMGSEIRGTQTSEYSGYSVSLSADGTIVAIGAYSYNVTGTDEGRVRIYKYNGTSWTPMGSDISGTQVNEYSGESVSLSADGTTVAIGSSFYNTTIADVGRTRVYRYNNTTSSWGQLGLDISGTQASENSGVSVKLSADGTTVAIGSRYYDVTGTDEGRTRVYKYNGTSWAQLGLDISGTQANEWSGYSVSLSADGTTVAIGSYGYDKAGGTTNANTNEGRTRIFRLNATTNALTYSSSSSSIADVCGNLLLIKGVNGTSTITATQTGNTVTGRLDVSGTTYTLQYNPFTYSISDASLATVSTYGTVTLTGTAVGTSTVTATQPATRNYESRSVSGSLVVSKLPSTLGALTVPAKIPGDVPFVLTAPTSTISSIISPTHTITSTTSVIVPPPDILDISYGTVWRQLGLDISGTQVNENSGYSVSLSADGTIVAIGSYYYDKAGGTTNANTDEGRTRVYKYNGTSWTQLGLDISGTQVAEYSGVSVTLSADGKTLAIGSYGYDMPGINSEGRTRIYNYNGTAWGQLGLDISGTQASEYSGFSVSLSADGTTVAIGSHYYDKAGGTTDSNTNEGRTRIYKYNGTSWAQLGLDISGNQANEYSGVSVSLSEDGTTVAIGSYYYDVTGTNNQGRARVYKYNSATSLWGQLGLDISGTQVGETCGSSVSLSADGTIVAIGSPYYDVTGSNNEGRTRIYKYNGTSWGQLGLDISGTQNTEVFGNSVSLSADGTIVAIGSMYFNVPTGDEGRTRIYRYNGTSWVQLGLDISGNQVSEYSGWSVSLSADGTTVAVGAYAYDKAGGTTNSNTQEGRTRIYTLNTTTNALTYSSSSSSIADVCGNLLLIKGVNGTSTITASQTGNTVTGRLDVSGTTYTLQYNPFTYTISDASLATVSTYGTVTLTGAQGTSTITATQPETRNYESRSVSETLVVSAIVPTIGALSAPAVNLNFGDASFNLTAPTSDSGGAFTYTSSAPGVATVTSGGMVTIVGAGSTTITATQASTTNYTGGSVTASLVVSPIAPTIGDLSAPAKNFGDASFNLTAPSSNSDGAFTYASSAPGVATVTSGGMVTIIGAGSTTITATQAASADGNYTGGSSVTASLVVSPIAPTYSSISQVTKTYGTDVSFSLTSVMSGVSNSDGAYTFSSTSAAIDICGGVATILAYTPSAITITATQAASGNYNGAGSTTFALLVNRKVPSYGAFSVPAATYEDVPFSIAEYAPTTDSTGVPFTYTSSEPTVATINSDGTVITIIGQGYTTITASQAAGGNYAASSTTTSFLVNRAAPTFLKAFTITNKTFGDASFSLLPFTEGLDNTDGTYHFTSSNAQLVSISEVDGVTATILAYTPTPITIYVAIDACGNYAASSTSGTLTVLRAIPTFGAFTVPAKNFRDASFNLTAPTSDSSGAFTYTSSDAAVATVTSDGGVVTIVRAGSTTITATQEINGNYTTRDISASLVVSPIAPTIGTLTAPAKNFGDASFNLTAPTSDSSGAFTYTSSNTAVATVTSGGTVTIVGVGTTTITATQAVSADGNYTTGSVTASLAVSASLSNFTVPAKTYGDASFNLNDPDTTDNTVGFTFASSNTSVATIDGRTVTIVGAGSTTITATQAATANRGELTISANLVVSKAQPVITIADITKIYGNPSFRPVPTTTNTDTSGGSVFTFSSNNIAVVSMLDATLVRINGIGTATLSITQAASANFTNATSSVVVTVNKGISGFSASTFAVASNKTFGDASFAITTKPISSSTGAITYSSSDEAVATIRSDGSGNSAITLVGQGTVTFTASQVESALYTADTKTSNTLTVARKTAALSRDTPSTDTITKYYGDANFSVSATNESNGAFSYSSSDPSFATINASTGVVTIVAVGSSTLTAARAQTAQYNADSVSWTLNIARGTTTLTGLSSLTRNVTVAPFSVTASSASDGAVSYALQDTTSTVLTIHPTSGLVTLLSPGSAVIVASQAQGTFYEAPTSITATITVSAAATTLQGTTLTGSDSFANVDLSGASLSNTTITNTNFASGRLNNSNFSGATISGANMSSSQLSSASLANTTITNTNFTSGVLNNANLNGASISNSNMTSADLSGATMRSATITGTDFTSANLRRTDLSGANVRGSIFNNVDLSGSTLTRMDASGASFINADLRGANLSNADFTNANMTNANISGANLTNVTLTIPQKLQLLKNSGNRARSEIQVSQAVGSTVLQLLAAGSAVRDVPNVANATFKVMLPSTSFVASDTIIDAELDIISFAYFYFPIGENEYFQIQGVKYYISGLTVRSHATGEVVETIGYGAKAVRLLAGSLTIIVNSQNTLASSSFVVPSMKQNTDASFSPITLPTSNSAAPIVYSSSNTNIATINSSTGLITLVADSHGFVSFTASQVETETHESASITSNELFVNKQVDFTLPGLNQTFSLSTLAFLDASSVGIGSTDATAVFYVRLSDMTNLFQYQTDAFDVNNTDASDIKYYVFHRTIPTAFHINPSHAMMNKTESAGMLGTGVQEIVAAKSLVKHDFIRYIALRLFNTHYGVDLFENEKELQENITYLGETVQHNIDTILSGISTTSANGSLSYDASGNKYLTNDSSGNTNLCRELMRQIAAAEGSRFYNNGADTATSGLRPMPLHEDDSINFKLTITAAPEQNILTGVSVIPSRTYLIKLVLKNTVNTTSDNTNTQVTDSEMYPNSYPYSTSVVTYAPTAESSSVYNEYSPPAPIPTARFGYNGWYYANTSAWVNVAPAVRDRVKWVVPSNAVGSSTVGVLRYIRMNLKVFNKTSLPFLVVTTQAGSTRKYTISAPNSLANGTVYSFYMNFNSYAREPATVGATNAELTYSNVGSGSFANGEVITSIAVETDGAAAASSVEFTLSSVVVGESSGEKEYGFSANV